MSPPNSNNNGSPNIANLDPLAERDILLRRMDAVGRLAEGISHEFNNLLTSILGFAYLIVDQSPETDPRKEFAIEIVQSGERAAELIRQMLEFSRKQSAHFERMRLHDCIGAHLDVLKTRLPAKVTLEHSFKAVEDRMWADAEKIQEIVTQLVANACDAMPEGGLIRVATRTEQVEEETTGSVPAGQYFLLSVEDGGEGIEAEVAEKMFDPFYSTRDVGKGTGLGLSIVHSHVEQHKGHLTFTSGKGEGSIFYIYLPCHSLYELPVEAPQINLPGGSGESILLVDDDKAVRSATAENLRLMGYRVEEAGDYEDAMAVAQGAVESMDLAMMNLGMPAVERESLICALMARNAKAQVLYYSSFEPNMPDEETELGDELVGEDEEGLISSNFLQKPFRPDRLAQAIRRALDGVR